MRVPSPDGHMSTPSKSIEQPIVAKGQPRPAPSWVATGPNRGTWAELLSTSPTIIHTLPANDLPLGAVGAVGPILKRRPAHFLVMPSWTLEQGGSETAAQIAASYLADHPRHELTFLCNTTRETELMLGKGCAAVTINQNCLVNDALFRPLPEIKPIYDAVYNARFAPYKRHELAIVPSTIIAIQLSVRLPSSMQIMRASPR